jgi:SAM-dependent methyltransferase
MHVADETKRDLLRYDEAEARLRARGPLSPPRVALVDEFVALLRAEGRASVVEFGSGPGGDGERFVAAGCVYVGIDLAFGNAQLAAERGVTVVQADLAALPIRSHTFAAGWSMSTLMHLPAHQVPAAAAQMRTALRPGAPLVVGMWGGNDVDIVGERGIEGQRRPFSLRSHDHNAELLAAAGVIEWSTTWDLDATAWPYHVFRLRTPG